MFPPPGKHWQYTPATLDEMDARGEIFGQKMETRAEKYILMNMLELAFKTCG
jgi:adenine-specific DNA-methyltransferase